MSGRLSLLLALAALLCLALSLLAGPSHVLPWQAKTDPFAAIVIMDLRLPRGLLALLVGGALGLAGAAMQGYLRNPLADPGLFGISSSAALGAVVAIGFGASGWPLPLMSFAGAAGGMALLALIAGRTDSLLVFTLAGVMLSSLTGALTALVISLAPNPFATSEIMNWLIGALTDRSWPEVALVAGPVLVGATLLVATRGALDALTLGEAAARSLGVDFGRLRLLMLLGVGLVTGAAVATTGVIGFVGLVVPHLLRPLVGGRPSALLLPSALGGGLLLLVADSIVRLLPLAAELRLGVVMALIGAPFFLALLMAMRRRIA